MLSVLSKPTSRGKRVVALVQPSRLTRSKKLIRPEIKVTTQAQSKNPIQAASEVHAADAESENPIQSASEDHAADAQPKNPIHATIDDHAINTDVDGKCRISLK